jgi:hypothetical protein
VFGVNEMLVTESERRRPLKRLGIDFRIILKCILREYDVTSRIGSKMELFFIFSDFNFRSDSNATHEED